MDKSRHVFPCQQREHQSQAQPAGHLFSGIPCLPQSPAECCQRIVFAGALLELLLDLVQIQRLGLFHQRPKDPKGFRVELPEPGLGSSLALLPEGPALLPEGSDRAAKAFRDNEVLCHLCDALVQAKVFDNDLLAEVLAVGSWHAMPDGFWQAYQTVARCSKGLWRQEAASNRLALALTLERE